MKQRFWYVYGNADMMEVAADATGAPTLLPIVAGLCPVGQGAGEPGSHRLGCGVLWGWIAGRRLCSSRSLLVGPLDLQLTSLLVVRERKSRVQQTPTEDHES